MLIALGRPTHFVRETSARDGSVHQTPACGAPSRALAPSLEDVNCARCHKTRAYRDARWEALRTKHGLPPEPAQVLRTKWVARTDDWYIETTKGWFWLRRLREEGTWEFLPNGPTL